MRNYKKVIYDQPYFWGVKENGDLSMLAEIRGFGELSSEHGVDIAAKKQDERGVWIAENLSKALSTGDDKILQKIQRLSDIFSKIADFVPWTYDDQVSEGQKLIDELKQSHERRTD